MAAKRFSIASWWENVWTARRMETKLFVVFVMLLVLPMGALSYVSASRYSASIERNTVDYLFQISEKMIGKLDDYITDLERISVVPFYLDEIKEGLKASNRMFGEKAAVASASGAAAGGVLSGEALMRLEVQMKLNESIYFLNNIKMETNTVYLFDQYGTPYTAMKSSGSRMDLVYAYKEWKRMADSARGLPVLVSTQSVSSLPADRRYVFTVVREILDAYRPIGMIAIDANIKVIEDMVRDLDRTTRGTTYIFDGNGRVIFDSGKKYIGEPLPRHELFVRASGKSGSFRAEIDGRDVLAIYNTSDKTGWKMLITVPRDDLVRDAMRTRSFTIAAGSVIVGFALAISLILIFALTRPLRTLVRLMREVQNGNMDVAFPVRRPDEAGLVGRAFNRMVDRIRSLIEDIYRAEQRKKQAQLEALQNQINPHFIYNTLESIRMTAEIHRAPEVGDMAHLLGRLIRYGVGSATETVPLKEEFEHLRMYVQLLNYRYGNRFTLRLPESGPDPEMPVMKLLFQPIVENAVYHGLDEKGRMEIVVDYRSDGRIHEFIVRDDGIGMTEDALRRQREKLERSSNADKGGIGLRNVHERLKLRYGESFGLHIDSRPGCGTSVTVRWPVQLT